MGVDSPKPSEHYLSTEHLTLDLAAHAANPGLVQIRPRFGGESTLEVQL